MSIDLFWCPFWLGNRTEVAIYLYLDKEGISGPFHCQVNVIQKRDLLVAIRLESVKYNLHLSVRACES